MTKTFSIIFLFLLFISCGKSGGGNDAPSELISAEVTSEEANLRETSSNGPVVLPDNAFTFEINAKLIGFTRDQEDKMLKTIELVKQVIASEKFKSHVINKKYNGKKTYVDNAGLSNSAIYKKLLDGAEKIGTTSTNNSMDVELQLYLDNNSPVVGYTYPSVQRIWMNKKFYNNFKTNQVAGNLIHEWLHKLGFQHAVKASASRNHSVPYAIGYIVRDLVEELEK